MIGQHLYISHSIEEDSAVHLDVKVGHVHRTIISNRHLDELADTEDLTDAAEYGSSQLRFTGSRWTDDREDGPTARRALEISNELFYLRVTSECTQYDLLQVFFLAQQMLTDGEGSLSAPHAFQFLHA